MYDLLESELVPEFYRRDPNGVPAAWIARIRESMARLTPYYSANRSVRDYTDRFYVPAASAYRERAANNGAVGQQVVAARQALDQQWPTIRFKTTSSTKRRNRAGRNTKDIRSTCRAARIAASSRAVGSSPDRAVAWSPDHDTARAKTIAL